MTDNIVIQISKTTAVITFIFLKKKSCLFLIIIANKLIIKPIVDTKLK